MFTVICCMFGGIGFGWLLRKQDCSWIQKVITLLIWVLLFLLGIEVGGNKKIISALPVLGLDALVIATLCTIGSCFFAWILWLYIERRKSR